MKNSQGIKLTPNSQKSLRFQDRRNYFRRLFPPWNQWIGQDRMIRADSADAGGCPSKDHFADTRLTHRVRAHETRFGGGVQHATRKVETPKRGASILNSNQLSMCGNIYPLPDGFNSLGDDLSFP